MRKDDCLYWYILDQNKASIKNSKTQQTVAGKTTVQNSSKILDSAQSYSVSRSFYFWHLAVILQKWSQIKVKLQNRGHFYIYIEYGVENCPSIDSRTFWVQREKN